MMLLITALFFGLSWFVGYRLKSKFKEYSQTPLISNLSGKEVAEKMLHDNNIFDVKVMSVEGQLTDHYNPSNKTVNLSHDVYYGRNAAAAAVSAHECGHALQHAQAYSFLRFRSAMVPALSITSRFMPWVIMIGGFILASTGNPIVLGVGVLLFAITTVFSIVTLPVEFDASKRALAWMSNRGVVVGKEYDMSKDALKWAALTYVVAALASIAQLLYYAWILFGRRD
jgi:Zn-dependent membrane protease YugP